MMRRKDNDARGSLERSGVEGSGRPASSREGMAGMRSIVEIRWLEFLGDVDDLRDRLGAAL
jgi:hypothetical protein